VSSGELFYSRLLHRGRKMPDRSNPSCKMTTTRRLAAILAADVAGYSRLMGIDEEGMLARLKLLRAELIDPAIAAHHGRIFKTTGDGLLPNFRASSRRCAAPSLGRRRWRTRQRPEYSSASASMSGT
jgi:class 3 adenylate cyclase